MIYIVLGGWRTTAPGGEERSVVRYLGTDRKGAWQWASTRRSAHEFSKEFEAQAMANKHKDLGATVVELAR